MKTSVPNRKDALGKGIRSLLQNIDSDLSATEKSLIKETPEKTAAAHSRIPLTQIEANPAQPRHDFDENALSDRSDAKRTLDKLAVENAEIDCALQWLEISGTL